MEDMTYIFISEENTMAGFFEDLFEVVLRIWLIVDKFRLVLVVNEEKNLHITENR